MTEPKVEEETLPEYEDNGSGILRDRIVILGRQGAGKTVYLSLLYDLLWKSNDDLTMKALHGEHHREFIKTAVKLRHGKWPGPTASNRSAYIEISYKDQNRLMVAMDYSGELINKAFVSEEKSDDTGPTTTLSGTDKLGDYYVTAKCGESDTGDSIDVAFNLGNESIWYHYNPSSGEIPVPCLPWVCDGEDSTEYDDCENELEVSCCQSDGTGGVDGCAYHYFYNDDLISSCIFDTAGDNIWKYKEADIDGTELRFFSKLKHVNADLDGDEGCAGYFCTKIEIYDCLNGEYDPDSPYWRRDTDSAPLDIDQGEECPGH